MGYKNVNLDNPTNPVYSLKVSLINNDLEGRMIEKTLFDVESGDIYTVMLIEM